MTQLFAAVLFIVSLSASVVLAAEPQVFKNSDLEKYSTGGSIKMEAPSPPADNSGQQRKEAEGGVSDRKYWCDAATQADNRVKKADENLSLANSRRGEAWRNLGSGNYSAAVEADARAQKDLESAEAELTEAKQESERIQTEAHQKNIPAGWLRCQFE